MFESVLSWIVVPALSVTLTRAPGKRAIALLAQLPWAIPATAIALGLAATFDRNDPAQLRVLLVGTFWILPLAYAVWAAFHPAEFTTRFALLAPLTLENFERAWAAAPFARYFFNTFVLVTLILVCQLVLHVY